MEKIRNEVPKMLAFWEEAAVQSYDNERESSKRREALRDLKRRFDIFV
jgi:hypothetical protein